MGRRWLGLFSLGCPARNVISAHTNHTPPLPRHPRKEGKTVLMLLATLSSKAKSNVLRLSPLVGNFALEWQQTSEILVGLSNIRGVAPLPA